MTAASPAFVSVVIPTYCRPASLRRCLASLDAQDYPRGSFEVIVVDDGGDPPADPCLPDALLRGVRVVVVRQSHQGVATARATGIARACGEILALLDDDCSVPPDYLAAIDGVFRTHPGTRVIQVGLANAEPDNIYGRAWKFAFEQTLRANLRRDTDGRLTSGILGGVMVARRDVFTTVAFAPAFTRGREDADLRYQLETRGIVVHYEPSIRVLHHYRRALRSYLAQFFVYGRGEFHLRRKWRATPAPFRYVSLTSWAAFRTLVRADGLRAGAAVYGALWLKRHAGVCGVLYETAASRFPRRPGLRTMLFTWLLAVLHFSRLRRCCQAVVRRSLAPLRRHRAGRSSH